MNLIELGLVVILPIVIAYVVVTLALTCKYHPLTKAIIIPEDAAESDSVDQQTGDLDSRSKLLVTVAVGLAMAVALSLILLVLGNLGSIAEFLGPLLALFDGISTNAASVMYVLFVLVVQLPMVASSFSWMTRRWAILIAAVYSVVFLAWVFIDSWITFDLMSILLCIPLALMLQQRISFLRLSLILMVLAVLYDAWQVYGTGNMMEFASKMLPKFGAEDRQITLPGLLMLPYDLSLTPAGYGILGLGDIVVFSLLAISAARFGRKVGSRVPVAATFVGFAVAIISCSLVAALTDSGQPATIFIVPLCSLPVIAYAKWRGCFDQLGVPFYAPAVPYNKDK